MSTFPFADVVGAEEAKLALLLAAIEPALGGVLLRGEKGSAKTTLARGLAALLADGAPFVDLPVGATEDRVVGSIDLAAALAGGAIKLRPGLLADADGGVLYVDEVNLLPDHIVDVLLDVAASGVNRVQREGVAAEHPSRFVLIGSMNPEEGELRPQLLDRFGLAVDVVAPTDPTDRADAVERRLAFDRAADHDAAADAVLDPQPAGRLAGAAGDAELAGRLARAAAAPPPELPRALVEAVGATCVAVGAQGLRADLVICRAAAALARWEGRSTVTEEDVRRVAPLALAHRARRGPLDQHGVDDQQMQDALDDAFDDASDLPSDASDSASDASGDPDTPTPEAAGGEQTAPIGPPRDPPKVGATTRGTSTAPGRRSAALGTRGRLVGDREPGPDGPVAVAVGATVREAVVRRAVGGGPAVVVEDLREAVRVQRTGNLVVLAVDASGSMGAQHRMEAAKGAVLSLLVDAYQRRDRIALVTFRDDEASVVLRPTGSIEVASVRLAELPTGGRTPLAAGIVAALDVATSGPPSERQPLIVLVTDGRATSADDGLDPVQAAHRAAAAVRRKGVASVVIDVESGGVRLDLAAALAAEMGADLIALDELSPTGLAAAVRTRLPT